MRSHLILAAILPLYGCASTPKAPDGGPVAPVPEASEPAPLPPAPAAPVEHLSEPENSWWHNAVFYEVFVRSFQDSDGDGIGDLRGLISRLDYLNDGDPSTTSDLGITALWLMPIFESPSYHGYDVTDYYRVDPDYGTEADLEALLAACSERGIHVILDLMLNHSSVEHPWFQEARSEASSPYRDWYLFQTHNPGWTQPWGNGPTWHASNEEFYYGIFWSGMPDLNFQNPAVEAEFTKIGLHWLDKGVAGFRLDAIRHLIEHGSSEPDVSEIHDVLKRLSSAWKSEYPEALLIGEIWDAPDRVGAYYGQGDELDLAFDFGISGAILGAISQGSAAPLQEALAADLKYLPVQAFSAPFTTNHDMDRLASQLPGDQDSLKLAASALFTLPGTPFIYYGEEIGLKNTGIGGDPAKRAPMQWTPQGPGHGFTTAKPWSPALGIGQKYAVQSLQGNRNSLWHHYQQLIALRQMHPSLNTGTLHGLSNGGTQGSLHFQRSAKAEVSAVLLNISQETYPGGTIMLDTAALEKAGLTGKNSLQLRVVYGDGGTLNQSSEGWQLSIPELSGQAIWIAVVTVQ